MPLWTIEPVAHFRDPRWLNHTIWRKVVVRAPSASVARVVASDLDRDPEAVPCGNESLGFRSGLVDEKLYRVHRMSAEEAAGIADEAGPDEVLLSLRADLGESSGPPEIR